MALDKIQIMLIVVGIIFSVFVSWWAHRKGKNPILYLLLSLFLSPIIAAIILQERIDKEKLEVDKHKLGIGYKIAIVFIILIILLAILLLTNVLDPWSI